MLVDIPLEVDLFLFISIWALLHTCTHRLFFFTTNFCFGINKGLGMMEGVFLCQLTGVEEWIA